MLIVKPGLRSLKSILLQLHSLHLFPYSFSQHTLSSTYYVPGNVLDPEDTAENLCPRGAVILVKEKQTAVHRMLGTNKS